MQILKTDCPECGAVHSVVIQPIVAPQTAANDLRAALANAHEALGEVAAILQQRNQDGWEERLLGIVNKALKGKPVPPPEPNPEPPKDNDPLPTDAPGGPNDSVPGDERP